MPSTPTDILARLRAANPAPVSSERANEPTAQATLERILNDPGPDPRSRSTQRAGRPRRPWLRAAPVLAATLVALAVVGAALVLLGRGHGAASGSRPPGGGIGALIAHTPQRQLRRELTYIAAATRGVENSKACPSQLPDGPTYIQGSPGSDLLSILGILRRPATPADRLTPQAVGPTPDIYRADIRRAFSADGVSYYIVPARYDPAAVIPSDRCFELQTAALTRYLPRIPAALRQPTRELQAALIAYFRTGAKQAPRDTICLVQIGGNDSGASCGIAPRDIEAGGAGQTDVGPNQANYSGVVPDGVATVTLSFPAARGRPAHAVTARVKGNVYAVQHSNPSVPAPTPTVIWRSPEGRVIKRISPPPNTAAARARACRQDPVACLLADAGAVRGGSSSSSGASPVRSVPARTPGG